MSEGIRNKVAVIGTGCTKFGELWERSSEDLMVEAFQEALLDAGIEKSSIQAVWQGNCFTEVNIGHSGLPTATTLKFPYLPVTHVENMCASGTEALRGACYAVASGACDIALAIGAEKLKDTGYAGLPRVHHVMQRGTKARIIDSNITAPGAFAMMATRYFSRYNLSIDTGRRLLARISVKSHHNGAMNPKAHLRKEITIEDVLNAPIIASPLGLFDCCGVSDGAAAAIVCRADMARNFRPDPVYVKAIQVSADSGSSAMYADYDFTHVEPTCQAAQRAYEEAGITDPRKSLSMMEVHDCFSITELVTYEDLAISARGRAREDIESGFFELDGKIPCQPSGGLKCFGHPVGATGLRMVYETCKQIQGKCGQRQVKNASIGLTHNLGGNPMRAIISVAILGA